MFEMGAKFDDGWQLEKEDKEEIKEIKSAAQHQLILAKEKRKGKVVTIVKPFFLEKKALQKLLKELKKKLSTGGTHKDNTLEFQGDITARLLVELECRGFEIKR